MTFAGRLAASYPSARISRGTLEEWAQEFAKLSETRADQVLDWLRDNTETAPSFKQIRLAMARAAQPKRAPDDWKGETAGLNDPCEFCGQLVRPGPDAAARFDAEFDRWHNAHVSCADAERADAVVKGR